MQPEHMKKIEELMGAMKCAKGFTCAQNGFAELCRVKVTEWHNYLVCLDKKYDCPFYLTIDRDAVCSCPLRMYIANKIDL